MRDEDLKSLPQSIAGWQVAEMLKTIGITEYRNVREVLVEPRRIQVTVLATDEKGQRYFEYRTEDVEVADLGEEKPRVVEGRSVPVAAEHVISIPFVGPWEKPEPEAEPAYDEDIFGCEAWEKRDGYRWQCARPLGHAGEHSYRFNTGRILGDAPQA